MEEATGERFACSSLQKNGRERRRGREGLGGDAKNIPGNPRGLDAKLIFLRMFSWTGRQPFLLEVETFSRYLKP
jgi:hypothetical protein